MLWGDTEINRTYTVSKDGYLFIENLGQIFVNGLTMDKLESKLLNQLKNWVGLLILILILVIYIKV